MKIKQITTIRKKIRDINTNFLMGFSIILWIVLLCSGLFLFSDKVLGAIEDFDSYPINTYLDIGTGNWLERSDPMRVLDTQYFSDPHSGACIWASNYREAWLDLTENNIQEIRFKIFLDECPSSAGFAFYDSIPTIFGQFMSGPSGDECEIMGLRYGGSTSLGTIPLDTWTTWIFQQSVVGPDSFVRYSINNGVDWSDWLIIRSGVVRDIDGFFIYSNAGNVFYVDDISGPPVCEIGSCNLCQWYGDCEASGCFWWYSIYEPGGLWSGNTGGWCIEPYEPDPEECGPLFKCQFCMDQATCEAEYCEWADRYGTGAQCYTPEPLIPEEQVAWEVPDLEDCEELESVEKWLCEIQNFATGIYMPSQEKINSLYYTIGAFKDRFPFSYVESLNRFFSDIKASLDVEKGIPIEILGQESEVDFVFWDNTTVIGGEEESIGNVLYDATSFLIIFGWFLWLISIIKRFL